MQDSYSLFRSLYKLVEHNNIFSTKRMTTIVLNKHGVSITIHSIYVLSSSMCIHNRMWERGNPFVDNGMKRTIIMPIWQPWKHKTIDKACCKISKMSLHNLGKYVFMLDLMDYPNNVYTTLKLNSQINSTTNQYRWCNSSDHALDIKRWEIAITDKAWYYVMTNQGWTQQIKLH